MIILVLVWIYHFKSISCRSEYPSHFNIIKLLCVSYKDFKRKSVSSYHDFFLSRPTPLYLIRPDLISFLILSLPYPPLPFPSLPSLLSFPTIPLPSIPFSSLPFLPSLPLLRFLSHQFPPFPINSTPFYSHQFPTIPFSFIAFPSFTSIESCSDSLGWLMDSSSLTLIFPWSLYFWRKKHIDMIGRWIIKNNTQSIFISKKFLYQENFFHWFFMR